MRSPEVVAFFSSAGGRCVQPTSVRVAAKKGAEVESQRQQVAAWGIREMGEVSIGLDVNRLQPTQVRVSRVALPEEALSFPAPC
jgi:hypothetical protein